MNEAKEINHEYDYSNIVPEMQFIALLIQQCETFYNELIKLCNEDEVKNEKLKYEYKDYEYKKNYSTKLEIAIRPKNNNSPFLYYNSYATFLDNVNNGTLKEVESLTISLDLSFNRGKEFNTLEHKNTFNISFKPYDIHFTRNSNYDDQSMDKVEYVINEMLKRFKVQNTIFCTKIN